MNLTDTFRTTKYVRPFVTCLASVFISLYLSKFVSFAYNLPGGLVDTTLRALPLFALFSLALYYLVFINGSILRNIYKYRFIIGAALFVFCLVFEISGSSIGVWNDFLAEPEDSGPLWGIARSGRLDEWSISTPFIFSQDHNSYQAINEYIRGTETSVSLMPSLPSFAIVEIFKPQYWGFLLFGVSRGLAWMWCSRVILLFLVTFELFMILTSRNKWLACCAAVILTFSPYAQWWGCFDCLLFGQLLVLLLNGLVRSQNRSVRFLCAAGIPWIAGCYLFLAYPAWIVPCFYVFLLLGIWVVATYFGSYTSGVKTWFRERIPEFCFLFLCVILVCFATYASFSEAEVAVEGIANTIYPGARLFVGGTGWDVFFTWISSPYCAIIPWDLVSPNPCEASSYFSLFPIGILIGFYAAVRWRRPLLFAMIALELFLVFFTAIGMPEWAARLTMLNHVGLPNRMLVATGFLDVAILLVSLSLIVTSRNANGMNNEGRKKTSALSLLWIIAGSLALSVSICIICRIIDPDFWYKLNLTLLFIANMLVFCSLGLCFSQVPSIASKCFCLSISAIVLVSGVCVNPVQRGIDAISSNPLYTMAEAIADENEGALWVAEGSHALSNLLAAAGAPSLSSTNIYPNIDLWKKLDPEGKYEEAYLRYAHVVVDIEPTENADTFELLTADSFRLNLTPEDLKDLGVKYVLTDETHEDTEIVTFNELGRADDYIFYELIYQ